MRNNAPVEHCVAEAFILHREIVPFILHREIVLTYRSYEYRAMKNKNAGPEGPAQL